jgi:hypothetical protein
LKVLKCCVFGLIISSSTGAVAYTNQVQVQNSNDSGTGSLREALQSGDVSITVLKDDWDEINEEWLYGEDIITDFQLDSDIVIEASNIALDFRDGITLHGHGLIIKGSNIVITNARIRDAKYDGIRISEGAYNIRVRNSSVARSGDGNLDITEPAAPSAPDNNNIEIRDSIFADAAGPATGFCSIGEAPCLVASCGTGSCNSGECEGGANDGRLCCSSGVCTGLEDIGNERNMLIGNRATNVRLYNNLLIGSNQRNPEISYDSSENDGIDSDVRDIATVDMVNNVIWDWEGGRGTRVERGADVNVVGNLFGRSPSSTADRQDALIVCDGMYIAEDPDERPEISQCLENGSCDCETNGVCSDDNGDFCAEDADCCVGETNCTATCDRPPEPFNFAHAHTSGNLHRASIQPGVSFNESFNDRGDSGEFRFMESTRPSLSACAAAKQVALYAGPTTGPVGPRSSLDADELAWLNLIEHCDDANEGDYNQADLIPEELRVWHDGNREHPDWFPEIRVVTLNQGTKDSAAGTVTVRWGASGSQMEVLYTGTVPALSPREIDVWVWDRGDTTLDPPTPGYYSIEICVDDTDSTYEAADEDNNCAEVNNWFVGSWDTGPGTVDIYFSEVEVGDFPSNRDFPGPWDPWVSNRGQSLAPIFKVTLISEGNTLEQLDYHKNGLGGLRDEIERISRKRLAYSAGTHAYQICLEELPFEVTHDNNCIDGTFVVSGAE